MLASLTIASLCVFRADAYECTSESKTNDADECWEKPYRVCKSNSKCKWEGAVPKMIGDLTLSENGKTLYDETTPWPAEGEIFKRRKTHLPFELVNDQDPWDVHFGNAAFNHVEGNAFEADWFDGDGLDGTPKKGFSEMMVLEMNEKKQVTNFYSKSYLKEKKPYDLKTAIEHGIDEAIFKKYFGGEDMIQKKKTIRDMGDDNDVIMGINSMKEHFDPSKNRETADIKKLRPKQLTQKSGQGTCALFSMRHLVHDWSKKPKFTQSAMKIVLKILLKENKKSDEWDKDLWKKGLDATVGHSYCHVTSILHNLEGFNNEIINKAMSYVGVTETAVDLKGPGKFEDELKGFTAKKSFLGLRYIYYDTSNWNQKKIADKLGDFSHDSEEWKKRLHSVAFTWLNGHWWYQNSNKKDPVYIANEHQLVLHMWSPQNRPLNHLYKVSTNDENGKMKKEEIKMPQQNAMREYFDKISYNDYMDDELDNVEHDAGELQSDAMSSRYNNKYDGNRQEIFDYGQEPTYYILVFINLIIILLCGFLCFLTGIGGAAALFFVFKFVSPKL